MDGKNDRRVLVALWMNGVFGQDVMNGIHDWMRDHAAPWRIRFADSATDDQVRITTPARAREIGSDYIVVGRPVTAAPDPVSAYQRCCLEFLNQ